MTTNDFYEKGFLGDHIHTFTEAVLKKFPDFYSACNHINELAYSIMMGLKVKNRDLQQLLVASVFIRVLNGFQSVVILSRLGLVFDAKVVLRAEIESLFLLKLLCEDKNFVTEYVKSDELRRLLWMNVARNSKAPHFDSLRRHATDEVVRKLKEEIERKGCKELSTEQIARRAGLGVEYDTDYRLLCEETHTLPRSVEHLTILEKGEPRELDPNPTDRELGYVIFTAIRCLHIALVSATKFFGVDRSTELAKSSEHLKSLAPLVVVKE